MREISLRELKSIIDGLCEKYPTGKLAFVYPKMRNGKRFGQGGQMTTYSVHLDSSSDQRAMVNIYIDWAREPESVAAIEPQEPK